MGNYSFQPIIITVGGLIIIFAVVAAGYYCYIKFDFNKIINKIKCMSGNLAVTKAKFGIKKQENKEENSIINTALQSEVVEKEGEVKGNSIMVNGNVCCKYCGAVIDVGSNVCKNCGKEQ